MDLLLSFSPSSYACFSSSIFFVCDKCSPCSFLSLPSTFFFLSVQQTVHPPPCFQSFSPSPLWFPSLSCVPLSCCFSHALLLPAPSSFSCTHTLQPCKVDFAHTMVLPLHWTVLVHICCFYICPFAHIHIRDLHICSFGDASQSSRLLFLSSFPPILRLILRDSQQITTVILSLFPALSQQNFLTPITHHSFLSTHKYSLPWRCFFYPCSLYHPTLFTPTLH